MGSVGPKSRGWWRLRRPGREVAPIVLAVGVLVWLAVDPTLRTRTGEILLALAAAALLLLLAVLSPGGRAMLRRLNTTQALAVRFGPAFAIAAAAGYVAGGWRYAAALGGAVAAFGVSEAVCVRSAAGHSDRRMLIRSLRLLGIALIAGGFLWSVLSPGSSSVAPLTTRQALDALAQAERQSEYNDKHPLIYHVRLTPGAERVADRFVYDEYVLHDCKAVVTLSLSMIKTETPGPLTSDACPGFIQTDYQNDSHLVRGYRSLQHNCRAAGALFSTGSPLRTNECVKYATEGRYVTNDNGTRDYECNGSYFEVFLRNVHSRWFVVAESDTLDWGGGCQARDITFWKHRMPWIPSSR